MAGIPPISPISNHDPDKRVSIPSRFATSTVSLTITTVDYLFMDLLSLLVDNNETLSRPYFTTSSSIVHYVIYSQ